MQETRVWLQKAFKAIEQKQRPTDDQHYDTEYETNKHECNEVARYLIEKEYEAYWGLLPQSERERLKKEVIPERQKMEGQEIPDYAL